MELEGCYVSLKLAVLYVLVNGCDLEGVMV